MSTEPSIALDQSKSAEKGVGLSSTGLHPCELVAMVAVSGLILLASYAAWWPITVTEAWGFVTGGNCVWLVVREHMWNWPLGLANNIFFFILFFQGRLFADMGLQVVYFGLGVYGWWNWLFGGVHRSKLRIPTFVGHPFRFDSDSQSD